MLIIKNLFKYIYISPFVYLFGICCAMSGNFISFLCILYLIIVHEFGHFFTAYILGVRVRKICIYPIGGISKLNMELNIEPLKELVILIMGPILQIIGYYLIIKISFFNHYQEIIRNYHLMILKFNLIPIYPLDGGRLLNIIFSFFFSLKKSFLLSFMISIFLILFYAFIYFNLRINYVLVFLFLIIKIYGEADKFNYYYERFLLERYLNNYKFKKCKIVFNINNFYRGKCHLVKIHDKYYTEKEILKKKYKNCVNNSGKCLKII